VLNSQIERLDDRQFMLGLVVVTALAAFLLTWFITMGGH